MANKWLIDSGCSRHMTGDTKWFASLSKASGDEKITFGNDAQGCIMAKGTVRVNENCLLKDVALVSKLSYNLISVSQLLDEGFEVRFKKCASRVLDSIVILSLVFLVLVKSLVLILECFCPLVHDVLSLLLR